MQRDNALRTNIDAQTFPDGVNSYVDPQLLRATQVRWAVNAVCKGGVWQTRPGYKTTIAFDVTTDGPLRDWWLTAGQPILHPQMLTVFSPTDDTPYLVFGLNGKLFTSKANGDGSFQPPQLISNITFDTNADQLFWAVAVKSNEIVNGVVRPITPQKYLIIQDGKTRAAYFNGASSGHLNPEKRWTVDDTGNTLYANGYNQTRIGTWMAWSGNRLWIADETQVYASDINDPLTFTEETVLVNVPSFSFDDKIMGMADRGTSGAQKSQVFVFTKNSVYTLWSGVQQRQPTVQSSQYLGGWMNTGDFQTKIFNGIGCIAGKSITNHRGLLHWYAEDGAVSFDSTGTTYSTQSLQPMDSELTVSKRLMGTDKSRICGGGFDSCVLFSVPVGPTIEGRAYNKHTQVLDKQTIPIQASSGGIVAWQGVWTGINPVEWTTAHIYGDTRIFALSKDNDGVIRIYEAFQGSRSDNGHAIPWAVETKLHAVTSSPFTHAKLRYAWARVIEIQGNLRVRVQWKGLRGRYHDWLDTRVTAAVGTFFLPNQEFLPIYTTTDNYSLAPQSRLIKTPNLLGDENTGSAGVESKYVDSVDCAFGLLFRFTGKAALLAYRLSVDAFADNTEGEVMDEESGIRILPEPRDLPAEVIDTTTPEYLLQPVGAMEAISPISTAYEEEVYTVPQP